MTAPTPPPSGSLLAAALTLLAKVDPPLSRKVVAAGGTSGIAGFTIVLLVTTLHLDLPPLVLSLIGGGILLLLVGFIGWAVRHGWLTPGQAAVLLGQKADHDAADLPPAAGQLIALAHPTDPGRTVVLDPAPDTDATSAADRVPAPDDEPRKPSTAADADLPTATAEAIVDLPTAPSA